MKNRLNLTIALSLIGVMIAMLAPTSVDAAKKKRYTPKVPITRKVLQTVPNTVVVGQVYVAKVKFTNRTKLNYKFQAWMEWGAYSYKDGWDHNPEHYWNVTTPRPVVRKLKPGRSRTMSFAVSFERCLPPWGYDPNKPGTLIPGYYFYQLPCASARWYLRTRGKDRKGYWGDDVLPFGGNSFIVPPPPPQSP